MSWLTAHQAQCWNVEDDFKLKFKLSACFMCG